jgi:hypothetical protein
VHAFWVCNDLQARSFKGAGCTPLELIEQRLGDQLSAPARKNLEEVGHSTEPRPAGQAQPS